MISSISSIEEAISLLFNQFHDNSIIYLSSRFKEFITKRDSNNISSEIINAYFNLRLQKDAEKDESEEIFELVKSKSEDCKVVMHFLIGLELEEMNDSVIEYFY
ncbi:hypothetical protein M9Y10_003252 [Tritrichomonas musculus]|uniref:Uncharacterized protein n=1 Tax=Tritrichomonas musculus TaxID=1915356 RepID=A0ABR2JPD4_9EUKA